MARWIQGAVAVIIPQIAGFVGSFFTASAIPGWYATLVRPEIAPPNWVFAPVWTILFLLMGIASYLVWRKGVHTPGVRFALALYAIQLFLNVLWSFVFFGLHNLGAALVELTLLWIAILATTLAFSRVSKTAAVLMLPYLVWVAFAGYLNYAFWMLN